MHELCSQVVKKYVLTFDILLKCKIKMEFKNASDVQTVIDHSLNKVRWAGNKKQKYDQIVSGCFVPCFTDTHYKPIKIPYPMLTCKGTHAVLPAVLVQGRQSSLKKDIFVSKL